MKTTFSTVILAVFILQFHIASGANNPNPVHCEIFIASIDSPEIKNEIINPEKRNETEPKPKTRKTKGYISIVEINYGAGDGKINLPEYYEENYLTVESYGFKWVNGYRFDEHLTMGLGLGIDGYTRLRSDMLTFYLPISLDARFEFVKNNFSPVININAGYAAGLSGIKGGTLINPSLGFRCYISNNTALLFNIGYKWQMLVLWDPDSYTNYYPSSKPLYRNVTAKFITFNLGLSF